MDTTTDTTTNTTTTTHDAPFGFGKFAVTTTTTPTTQLTATDVPTLKTALGTLATASAGPTVLTLGENTYNFKGEDVQTYVIRASRLTIQPAAGKRVVLKNLGLEFELDSVDKILIQDLVFRSDGEPDKARDGISFNAIPPPKTVPTPATPPTHQTTQRTDKARVRITHCSFDGYFDICIDSRSYAGAPRLLATIDQCIFFDGSPGSPETPLFPPEKPLADRVQPYTNRGAINFGSLENPDNPGGPQLVGNAYVTVAYNVFIDVWRRSPRIAASNFGHIYNNLLYRWGFGNTDDGTQGTATWRGMVVGGGEGVVGGGSDGIALIQANRFIAYAAKKQFDRTIDIGRNTTVDIQGTPALPNEFDKESGLPRDDSGAGLKSFPTTNTSSVDTSRYTDPAVALTAPTVTAPTPAQWLTIINTAGPRGGRTTATAPEGRARKKLIDALPSTSTL